MSNVARRLAEIPAGSWTKWLVIGFWVVVLVFLFGPATKLTGVEKNDAKTWVPASAESVKVLDAQSRFESPNVSSGVVVYVRPSGLTAADRGKAAADARRFAGIPASLLAMLLIGPPQRSGPAGLAGRLPATVTGHLRWRYP